MIFAQTKSKENDGVSAIDQVYRAILSRYVAEIDPQKLSDAAIQGMLDELDPYSEHLYNDNSHRLDDITNGEYGGIGVNLGRLNDTLIVVSPMVGTPAFKQGILSGDRILKIDSVWTRDLDFEDASLMIRGEQGDTVTLLIERPGEQQRLSFELERELIKVPDISYSGILQDRMGYIRLSNFTKYSAEDLENALRNLVKANLNGLILDLRGNPGGLLSSALMSADLFLDQDRLLLETRGRIQRSNRKYLSKRPAVVDLQLPMAVLVDGGSASASEILSGILQDYDRAVVIGEPTFGKGLVQTVTQLSPETRLKLTTAKYYLPSGRLIQKREIAENIIYEDLPDSDKLLFFSGNNREFKSGEGVRPDLEVENLSLSDLEREMWRKRLFFKYALDYSNSHPGITLPINLADTQIDSFYQWLQVNNSYPKTKLQHWIDESSAIIDSSSVIAPELDVLRAKLSELELVRQQEEMQTNRVQLLSGLETEIASVIGGNGARVAASLKYDPVVNRAIELLASTSEVNEILAGKQRKSDF
ncbi:MAG: S41 family peptidase [Candidatus Marinimicrobia bacterium]|nr:S41 family peptidase [Candidatus Neomarinimicrobiota bacterium]